MKNKSLIIISLFSCLLFSSCSKNVNISKETFNNIISASKFIQEDFSYSLEHVLDYRDESNTRFNTVESAYIDLSNDLIISQRKIKSTSETDSTFKNQHYEEKRKITLQESSIIETTDVVFYQSRYYSGKQFESGKYCRIVMSEYSDSFFNKLFHLKYDSVLDIKKGMCFEMMTRSIEHFLTFSSQTSADISFNNLSFQIDYTNASYVSKSSSYIYSNKFVFNNDINGDTIQKGNCYFKIISSDKGFSFIKEIEYFDKNRSNNSWMPAKYLFSAVNIEKCEKADNDTDLVDYSENNDIFKYI